MGESVGTDPDQQGLTKRGKMKLPRPHVMIAGVVERTVVWGAARSLVVLDELTTAREPEIH